MQAIDIESLDPVERMELADVLYDSAMQAIENSSLTPEQIVEIDRRLQRLAAADTSLIQWDEIHERLYRSQ